MSHLLLMHVCINAVKVLFQSQTQGGSSQQKIYLYYYYWHIISDAFKPFTNCSSLQALQALSKQTGKEKIIKRLDNITRLQRQLPPRFTDMSEECKCTHDAKAVKPPPISSHSVTHTPTGPVHANWAIRTHTPLMSAHYWTVNGPWRCLAMPLRVQAFPALTHTHTQGAVNISNFSTFPVQSRQERSRSSGH